MSRMFRFLLLLIAALVLLVVVIFYNVSAIVSENKSFVEETLSDRLHARVTIGQIQVSWRPTGPVFILDHVNVVPSPALAGPVALQTVDMSLDLLGSLVSLTPQIYALDLHGISFEMNAPDAAFVSRLHAFAHGAPTGEAGEGLAFLASLHRFSINDARLALRTADGGVSLMHVSFTAHRLFGAFEVNGRVCPLEAAEPCYLTLEGSAVCRSSGCDGANLQVAGSQLLLPVSPFFPEPWHASHLAARIGLKRQQDRFELKVTDIRYRDPDAQASGEVGFIFDRLHGRHALDIDLRVSRANAAHATRYIPSGVLSDALTRWLRTAIGAGEVTDGEVRIKGNLEDIPRHDGGMNLFSIVLGVKNGRLRFDAAWPEVTGVSGNIVIGPSSLAIHIAEGASMGVALASGKVLLADFADPAQKVQLDLPLVAGSAEALRFLAASPLNGGVLAAAQKCVMPTTRLGLELTLPLAHDPAASFSGAVRLAGAEVTYGDDLRLTGITGRIGFTRDTLDARELTASFWGMPLSLDLANESFARGKPLFVKIKGDLALDKVGAERVPWLSRFAEGSSPFSANLVMTPDKKGVTTNLNLSSSLEGVTIHIPQVYSKEKQTAAPLKLIATIDSAQRATVHAVLADTLVLHGISRPGFDFLSDPRGAFYRKTSALTRTNVVSGFAIDTPRVKGRIGREAGAGSRLTVHLSLLDIAATAAGEEPPAGAGTKQSAPQFTPFGEISFKIDVLRDKDELIRNLVGMAVGSKDGITLRALNFTIDDTRFNVASASYRNGPTGPVSAIEGELVTQNLGQLLQSQDIFTDLRVLSGNVRFALHWPQAPWQFERRTLAGTLDIDLTQGRLKNSNSILNRIVNLITLNLQQTLRSDLEIKSVKGRLSLSGGQVATEGFNIEITGAKTESHGTLNLVDETIDGRVAMTIDLSRLIKIGIAFVINPVVGGLYWWKGDPDSVPLIDNLTRHNYAIKGPWRDPQVSMLPLIKLQ